MKPKRVVGEVADGIGGDEMGGEGSGMDEAVLVLNLWGRGGGGG